MHRHAVAARRSALVVLLLAACGRSENATRATLITNVRIFDGSGGPPTAGSVRVVGDTVAAVPRHLRAAAGRGGLLREL